MPSLASAGLRFNSLMHRTDGMPFHGTIEPDLEGKLIGYDFSFPRRLLRVSADCKIKTRDVIRDVLNRHYLVADHDGSFAYNVIEYQSYMLIPLVKRVSWQREASVTDPLTKLAKSAGKQDLGMIWILPERVGREMADNTMRVKEEVETVFTAHELELNDIVDGMSVRRINVVRGVYLAEVQ